MQMFRDLKTKPLIVVVGWLLNVPSNMLVYLRDGSAQTNRLVGLVVRHPPRERKVQVRIPLALDFFRGRVIPVT